MYHPKYAMFFDNHTMKTCPDAGHAFHPAEFARGLHESGVDFLGFHAKCNQGFCYFNTKTGTRHPALPPTLDLFGDTVRECGKLGIRVSAYLNCGLSNETAVQHPDWTNLSPEGRMLHPDIYSLGDVTPYMRVMCLNSPYRDYFFGLVREVLEQYPVAGFLFDSFNAFPCVCPHCVEGMRKLGMDFRNPEEVNRFAYSSAVRMAEDLARILREKNPELLHYYLGLHPEDNARIGSYMECECLPTNPAWGYDFLPVCARSLRRLTSGPVLNMTGRFYDWGDFGSLRTKAALEYDLFFGLANGMRPNIGDHLLPSGKINRAVSSAVKEIYSHVRKYEKWYENARNPVDLAVVVPEGNFTRTPSLAGASRMLSELKMQFDIIDSSRGFGKYRLLVLPDNITLTDRTAALLKEHFARGGRVFASGVSGMNPEKNRFVLEKEFGVKYAGECGYDPAYFRIHAPFSDGVPEMPLAARKKGILVERLPGTEAAGEIVKPYWNRHFDGVYSYFYAPPEQETEFPFLTLNGMTAFCAFPLFAAYTKAASVEMRTVFGNILSRLLPDPLLRTENLPSYARAFVTEDASGLRRMIHLLNYIPELRGEMLIVEEESPAVNVKLSLRLDGRRARRVFLAPDGPDLAFAGKNGRVEIELGTFSGYAMAVVELE